MSLLLNVQESPVIADNPVWHLSKHCAIYLRRVRL